MNFTIGQIYALLAILIAVLVLAMLAGMPLNVSPVFMLAVAVIVLAVARLVP